MDKLAGALENYRPRVGRQALPNDSECPTCSHYDKGDPRVAEILLDRDPSGRLLDKAGCICKREREKAHIIRLHNANLPFKTSSARTFANYNGVPGTTEMINAAKEFVAMVSPTILVLGGGYGIGKTHILEAIGWGSLDADRPVRYELVSTLLDRLRHTYSSNSTMDIKEMFDEYDRYRVLLLDDMGMEKATDWAMEKVTALVERRLTRERQLAIATNLNEHDLGVMMGPRLESRMFGDRTELGLVRVVWAMGEDYRKGRAQW
jgi:DNA replication protein DnaC